VNQDFIVIILLIVLLALQQVFFLREIQKLAEKVMSKNYGEYLHGEFLKKETVLAKPDSMSLQVEPSEEDRELARLNAMINPPL